jgi:putative ABC transport system permease protein
MFDVPFAHGSGWTAADDSNRSRVVVLSKSLNDKLFGGENSVGRRLRLGDQEFTVFGVLDRYEPTPQYYDVINNAMGKPRELFLPFDLIRDQGLGLVRTGDADGFGNFDRNDPNAFFDASEITWIQYWVELDSPAKVDAYRQYLTNYSEQQRAAGRFDRPTNVRLRDVMELLDFNHAVPSDVRLQTWLAFGFMIVCLLNTVGLLLAKFLRRSSEIGVRRALGASRRAIFTQCMVEAGVVGLAGGAGGLGLALLGLWAVRQQPSDYAKLAHLDPAMLLTTFVIAIVASLLAGALPAWRACQVAPAIQLKSQ